jgi:phytoene dehydrogenase-like protein
VYDVIVVGAGFGGLGTALTLGQGGARVLLCEALRYPGGCASTFSRGGFRFDAGATLVSGLEEHQLFGRWLARYSPETEIEWLDPVVTLRAPRLAIEATRARATIVEQLAAAGDSVDAAALRRFFRLQEDVAGALWALFEDPALLPPFSLRSLLEHARRLGRYLPIARLLGRSLGQVIRDLGLEKHEALRVYTDALCQITVQCPAREAEAAFALSAMDYYHRGTGHVRGGVGSLADALVAGCRAEHVEVELANRVRHVRRDPDGNFTVETRRGARRARAVVANLLPTALETALGEPLRGKERSLAARVDDAWGAVMLYAVARTPSTADDRAHHLELVRDPSRPFVEGNHVFVSISSAAETDRAPLGRRTLTMSTHVALSELRSSPATVGARVQSIQSAMKGTLSALAPEWAEGIESVLPASPRTFAKFVGRPGGAVGGVPRRAGLDNYASLGPHTVSDRLWLVGDSVFPGQSALATAIGGVRTASSVLSAL